MACLACKSNDVAEFGAEIAVHSPTELSVPTPHLMVFPTLVVCLRCGFTGFKLRDEELRMIAEASAGAGRMSLKAKRPT